MNSSGNILADRRFAWARALADDGDHAAAADLLVQVVELVPDWAAAWVALAEAQQTTGETESAAAAWRRAAALDEDGRLGAGLRMALLEGSTPGAMPTSYLEALFDGYAARFEPHLVEQLSYRGPQLILDALVRVQPSFGWGEALDLGCGTGLMGSVLAGLVAAIDGVDLSARMVDAARERAIYRQLWVAPLLSVLDSLPPRRYDLVTAADVLVYVGDLAPLISEVARALVPGGFFAFTAQLVLDEGTEPRPFVLGQDLRFSHSRRYVEGALAAAGLRLASVSEAWARTENGTGVPGLVVVARGP